MVDRGAPAIPRLSKRDVERLLATYDADPIAALSAALRITLGMPGAAWPQLIAAAPFTGDRRADLLRADARALDALAAELNENRSIDRSAE